MAAVSATRMQEEVAALVALGPRMGGTPSGDRAAAALAQEFRNAGLAVEIVEDPPRLAHFETRFEAILLGPTPRPLESAWPYGFSPSLARGDRDLVVVDDASAFDWSRASGKAVLTHAPPRLVIGKVEAARVAALLTDFQGMFRLDPSAAFVSELKASTENRVPVFAVSRDEATLLRKAAKAGGVRLRLALESTIAPGSAKTVVARLGGADPSLRLVLCAHGDSDSGGPGADDNASGEAVLLEVARVLAGARRSGTLPALSADVEFVIWGSEIHSTREYIRRLRADGSRRVIAVLNYDQAGTGAERNCLYVEPDDVPLNQVLVDALADLGVSHARKPGFWTEFTTNRSLGGTDSYVFLEEGEAERIPAVTIFTAAFGHPSVVDRTAGRASPAWTGGESIIVDFSAYYHSSRDVPETTVEREPWNMVWCARMGILAVVHLLGPNAPKSFRAGAGAAEQRR